MKNLKYFIPIIGALLKNNPYYNRFRSTGLKETLFDLYHMFVSLGVIVLLAMMTF